MSEIDKSKCGCGRFFCSLHAAAPDLYAALEAATTAMTMEGLTRNPAWKELHAECRAALAKAKGGT